MRWKRASLFSIPILPVIVSIDIPLFTQRGLGATRNITSHRRGGNLPPEKPSLEIKKAPLCKGSWILRSKRLRDCFPFLRTKTFGRAWKPSPRITTNPPQAGTDSILFSLFTLHFKREGTEVRLCPDHFVSSGHFPYYGNLPPLHITSQRGAHSGD